MGPQIVDFVPFRSTKNRLGFGLKLESALELRMVHASASRDPKMRF